MRGWRAVLAGAPGTILLGGKCLTPGVEGTRCGVQDGALLGVCSPGTWCDTGALSHGTCQPAPREGESCAERLCGAGLTCSSTTATCVAKRVGWIEARIGGAPPSPGPHGGFQQQGSPVG
jgi:hypothetical protein